VTSSNQRPREAFILSKRVETFQTPGFIWGGDINRTLFADLDRAHDVQFFAGAGTANDTLPVDGVKNIGKMSLEQFYKRLAESRMVVSTPMLDSAAMMESTDKNKLPCYNA